MSVTFGTPVVSAFSTTPHTPIIALTGVTSGQPIVLFLFSENGSSTSSAPTDTFATPYTWTRIVNNTSAACFVEVWIGTGGVGTLGTITGHYTAGLNGGYAVPCIGASTASGASAVDVSASKSGSGLAQSLRMTPNYSGEGAVVGAVAQVGGNSMNTALPSPWVNTRVTADGYANSYPSPPSGSLPANWTTGSSVAWATAGVIVKAASDTPFATVGPFVGRLSHA